MASNFTAGKFQAEKAGGVVPGAKLYSYAAGTTTPQATYTDQGGLSPNANPVVCDANGQASVWLGSSPYRMILKDASDVLIWDVDNISAPATLLDFIGSGGSANVGFIQPAGVARTVQSKLRDTLSAKDFGAVGDGATDDTAAIARLITAGGGWLGDGITYKINSGLSLDVSLAHLIGAGCTFDFSGGGSLEVFSTATFPELVNTTRVAVKGVRFIGPNTIGSIGTTIGKVGASYAQSSQISFENCAWYRFGKLLNFTDNSWRTSFTNCRLEQPVTGGHFAYQPLTVSNSGECMEFWHCLIADGTGEFFVNFGQWHLRSTSVGRDCTLHAANVAYFNLEGSHLESQPDTGYRMLQLDNNASCTFVGGDITIDGGTVFTKNPILLNGADTQLTVLGTYIPMNLGSYGRFEQDTSLLRDWVVGTGRCYAAGLQTNSASTLTGIGNNINFSKLCNLLSNGDAEYGNTNNWTTATFGTAGSTLAATAGSKLNGAFGFLVTTVATGGITCRQNIPASFAAGRLCILSAVHKVTAGTGNTGQLFMRFLDLAGATISSIGQNWLSTDTNFTYGPVIGYAPLGTQTIQVEFNGQANAGIQTIFVDEVCLNVL